MRQAKEMKTEQSTSVFYLNVYLYSLLCLEFLCVEFLLKNIRRRDRNREKKPHQRGSFVFVVYFFGLDFKFTEDIHKQRRANTFTSQLITCNSSLCVCAFISIDSKNACVVRGFSLDLLRVFLTVINDEIPCECFIFKNVCVSFFPVLS